MKGRKYPWLQRSSQKVKTEKIKMNDSKQKVINVMRVQTLSIIGVYEELEDTTFILMDSERLVGVKEFDSGLWSFKDDLFLW